MILRWILGQLQASVENVRNTDSGRRWLRTDKATQLLELGAWLATGTVIDEQEEFESSTVAAQWNQTSDRQRLVVLRNDEVILCERWRYMAIVVANRHVHLNRRTGGKCGLRPRKQRGARVLVIQALQSLAYRPLRAFTP